MTPRSPRSARLSGRIATAVVIVAAAGCGVSPASIGSGPPPNTTDPPVTVPAADAPVTYRYGPLEVHQLDLYRPDSAAAVPVVVFIHGGAWVSGNRFDLPPTVRSLTARGIAVASIDDRLAGPGATHPAQVVDVRTAVAWLDGHGAALGLDRSRIVLAGYSSGGHSAVLAAMSSGDPDTAPLEGTDAPVAGVVNIAGALEPSSLRQDGPSFEDAVRQLLGCGVLDDCPVPPDATAEPYLDPSDPPVLSVYGGSDWTVSADVGRRFHQAAGSVGIDSELRIVDGAGHDSILAALSADDLATWINGLGPSRSP